MKYCQLYQIQGRWTRLYIMVKDELLTITFNSPSTLRSDYRSGMEIKDAENWFENKKANGFVYELDFSELSDLHRREIIDELFWSKS